LERQTREKERKDLRLLQEEQEENRKHCGQRGGEASIQPLGVRRRNDTVLESYNENRKWPSHLVQAGRRAEEEGDDVIKVFIVVLQTERSS